MYDVQGNGSPPEEPAGSGQPTSRFACCLTLFLIGLACWMLFSSDACFGSFVQP
jgi:hypothetical protein